MKKFIWLANSLLFCSILTTGGIAFWVLPKQTISNDENRHLMDFPQLTQESIFSGKFEKAFEEYYNDHFPLRDHWLELSNTLNSFKGIKEQAIRVITFNHNEEESDNEELPELSQQESTLPDEEAITETTTLLPETQTSEEISSQEPTQQDTLPLETVNETETEQFQAQTMEAHAQPIPSNMNEEFNRIKGVVVVKGRVLQVFAGSKSTISPYVSMLSAYRQKLPSDVKMYAMMIPSGSDFYLPYQVNKGVLKEKENIELFNSLLPQNIVSVPAYEEIAQHKDEYIQFRTDHHWTGLGAYYAYIAFAKTAEFQPLALTDMQFERKNTPFLGSLYHYTKDNELKKYPDILEYYKVPTHTNVKIYGNSPTPTAGQLYSEKSNNYMLFIGGDHPLMHFHTQGRQKKSLLVVKDSFGNALIPYLTAHYQDIYVIDYRYFKGNIPKLMKRYGIKELLYAHNTFAANTKTTVKFGMQMLK